MGHISLALLELESSGVAGPGARPLGTTQRQQNGRPNYAQCEPQDGDGSGIGPKWFLPERRVGRDTAMCPEARSPGANYSKPKAVRTGYASHRAAVIALCASRRQAADDNAACDVSVLLVVRGVKTVQKFEHIARRPVVSMHPQRHSPLLNCH